jgi:hypothetical protein
MPVFVCMVREIGRKISQNRLFVLDTNGGIESGTEHKFSILLSLVGRTAGNCTAEQSQDAA